MKRILLPQRALAGALGSLIVLVMGAPARADSITDLESLLAEPVVSTVSKKAERASVAPATMTVILAEDLQRFGIHTVAEALNFLSLGMITENPYESVDIGARGVLIAADYGNHILLLLDGHRMNEAWAGASYFDRGTGIPLAIVDHIEVILGPGSVLYGSNAMLGVINIVTKRARNFDGGHVAVESEIPISIRGTAGVGKEFSIFGQHAEVTAIAEYFSSRGPAFPFGPQDYGNDSVTGLPRRFSFDGKVAGVWEGNAWDNTHSVAPSGYTRLVVGNFELFFRASLFKRWTAFTQYGWGDVRDPEGHELDRWIGLDARYHATLASFARLLVRAYADGYDYRYIAPLPAAEDCLPGQIQGCVYRLLGNSRWLGSEIATTFDWLHNGRLVTLVGIDGWMREVAGTVQDYVDAVTGQSVPAISPYGDFELAFGAYAEQTARPLPFLDLNAGVRLDSDQRFGTHVSPRVAAIASPWKGSAFKAIYAEAFRGPTAYERYAADGTTQIAALDLGPEIVRSIEGSFEQRFGTRRLFVSVFRSWWRDLVVYGSASEAEVAAAHASGELDLSSTSASRWQNASSIANFGGQLAFDGSELHQRLQYGLGVTAAYARQDANDGSGPVELPVAAQLFGNARIAYDLGGRLPVLALAGRFAGPRPVAYSNFVPTPYAPPLVELRATLSGAFPFVPNLSYRTSANAIIGSGSPYAIGPLASPAPGYPRQELIPVDHFRVTTELSFNLPFSRADPGADRKTRHRPQRP